MKFWILFVCLAVGIKAQSDEAPDYWNEDFDDDWYKAELEKLGIISNEDQEAPEDNNNFNDYDNIINIGAQEKDQNEMDKQVEEEIQEFQEKDNTNNLVNNDYQVEDNRSESADNTDNQNEGAADDEKLEISRDVNDINENDENENIYDDYKVQLDDTVDTVVDDLVKDFFDSNESDESDANEGNEGPNQVSKNDDMIPLPMPPQQNDNTEQILEETKAILLEDTNEPNDFADEKVNVEVGDDLTDIFEETKKLIEETNDQFDEESANDGQQVNEPVQENSQQEDSSEIDENLKDLVGKLDSVGDETIDEEEDTVDKVYQDLNEDLDSLFETLNKLTNSASNDHASVNVDYAINSNENLDDKNDYETVFDSNLSDLFAEHSKVEDNSAAKNDVNEESPEFESWQGDEPTDAKQKSGEAFQLQVEVDELSNGEPDKIETTTNKSAVSDNLEHNAYINDAFVSKENDDKIIATVDADALSDVQLEQLMNDFAIQHEDVFGIDKTDGDHVVLNHVVKKITLQYGETQFITTDNYPEGYPTNRITDWIIIGEGKGIEFNVTAFSVNGALGDYLLVKPGQLDEAGSDGLVFSYHLNSPRAYRFVDVDRMFMRFESKNGFIFHTGFNITVKMIAPVAEEPEPEPEPEPLLPEPVHHLNLILGGLSLAEFTEIREDFRLLVANMATMYINANGIDPGMNTTAEVTQITSASICDVKWPGFEICANLKVAVPLVYEEEQQPRLNVPDLQAMWNEYANRDPFAARLRQMGITEFSVPDDGGVLTVWIVVGLGVLVSAIMMAFALWRYSCFEDYSRMPEFSDSDSISHKRLDLYPTPHQTLPPLYSDNEYKWDNVDSTRVDMGGFTNSGYVRNDMYDLDSDEDVVAPRDRNAGIQPRDIFSV